MIPAQAQHGSFKPGSSSQTTPLFNWPSSHNKLQARFKAQLDLAHLHLLLLDLCTFFEKYKSESNYSGSGKILSLKRHSIIWVLISFSPYIEQSYVPQITI